MAPTPHCDDIWTAIPQPTGDARSAEGRFVIYGIGVSLNAMHDPVASGAFVPVA